MPTTVEELEVEVTSSSRSAVDSIDTLSASLQRLKAVTKGGIGLTNIAKQVSNLGTSLSAID